ncbi:sigma factor-like helix-turn-helix DNA-binding protein [Bacillus mycoides]|uniref:sigma factor-like helix-turn-helix DNA-binding protein n=1 Tax=Bacillus mycoides TaxID=1405 RepID=UPI0036E08CBD
MGSNQIEAYCNKHKEKMDQPIVQSFLKDEKNYELFQKAILNPTNENTHQLNQAFSEFYRKIKIVNYISNLIYFYSIDFDKKVSLYKKRNVLKLDAPLNDEEAKSSVKMETFTDKDLTYKELEYLSEDIKDVLSDDVLFEALCVLSDKQIRILNLKYINNFPSKKIAEIMWESEQTVSYNLNRALEKMKEFVESKTGKSK